MREHDGKIYPKWAVLSKAWENAAPEVQERYAVSSALFLTLIVGGLWGTGAFDPALNAVQTAWQSSVNTSVIPGSPPQP